LVEKLTFCWYLGSHKKGDWLRKRDILLPGGGGGRGWARSRIIESYDHKKAYELFSIPRYLYEK
jgi:hypothetical protein